MPDDDVRLPGGAGEGSDTPQGDPNISNLANFSPDGTPSTEAPQGKDRFKGKSPEEIADMYENLQKEYSRAQNENKELRLFATRVLPFFKIEGESMVLNEDMVRQYAEAKGWLGKSNQQVLEGAMQDADLDNLQNGNTGTDEDLKSLMQEDPIKALQKVVRNELKKSLSEVKQPVDDLKRQIMTLQQTQIIREAMTKEPGLKDRMADVGRWIEQHNFPVNSPDDLVKAYQYTLMDQGRFIPKEKADSYIQELERTLAQVSPNAISRLRRGGEPREISNEEFLGLKSDNSEKSKILQALMGKGNLKPP